MTCNSCETDSMVSRNGQEGFAVRMKLLSDEGMSTRAIAPVVGVSDRQVRYDSQVGNDFPPAGPALASSLPLPCLCLCLSELT